MKLKALIQSKFTRDTIWLTLAQFVVICSGFFINLFIGREYGFSEIGYFHQSLAFYMILTILFALGINNSVLKNLAERPKLDAKGKNLFTSAIFLTGILSVGFTAITLLLIRTFPFLLSSPELLGFLKIHLLALPFFCLNKNFAAFYSSRRNQKKLSFIRAVRWAALSALLFLFIQLDFPLQEAIWSFLIVEAGILSYNIFSNQNAFDFRFSKANVLHILRFGLGSYVSEITSVVNTSMDVIIVGYLLSKEDAGCYGFVIYFIKTLYIFPGILMQNLSPIVASHWSQKTIDQLNLQLGKLRKINFSILLLQSVFLMVFFYASTRFLNNGYADTLYPFSIALAGSFIFASISWGGSILIMTGKLKANFYRTSTVLLLNLSTFALLTYYAGFLGSTIAIAINGLFSFLLLRTFIHRQTGIKLI